MKYKLPKKLELGFYLWLAIVPIFCIGLDLILSITNPVDVPPFGLRTRDFDISFMAQSIYLSVWVGALTSIYGIINTIAFFKPDAMPKWVVNKNFFTALIAVTFVQFLVYNLNLIYQKSTNKQTIGFNTWYNIIKSILEHMLTPILMFTFYYLFPKSIVKDKDYMKKYSWLNYIFLTMYVTFAITRAALEIKYYPGARDESMGYNPFPYPQLDWQKVGVGVFIVGIIGLYVALWLIAVFFNYTSNLVYAKQNNLANEKKPRKVAKDSKKRTKNIE
ncbi:hypothetical protein [Spiroplasma tabanidicola]|uniref:Uncharacterized protein n=1 Tax=Spiroplasma tabanidicola TaxID=324079 RepID=A0A6I6CB66_9MOLU|nr:hypothetical protein [Spiroplasma tabanidicola]QGS52185.1 hypothetical protein STABA_v1c08300 [Spiroplasma tabanidicola]